MSKTSTMLICLVLALQVSNSTVAGQIIMQCDVGGCGLLQSGWTGLGGCGSYTNVGGTGIDVTLATGNPGACQCRNEGGTGALADVETDLLFADNQTTSPASDFILTLGNLVPGVSYRVLSYHNRWNEAATTIPSVMVTGATVISKPDTIVQDHPIMENPAEIIFVAASSEVSVRYQGPDGGCPGCQAFFNGFILEYGSTVVGFDSASSGNPESVSPAILTVTLSQQQSETVTVDYAVTGGTAEGNGVDYTLEAATLTFDPNETVETISIAVVSDGLDEDDETIIITLSNVDGGGVQLGTAEHTCTIIDPRPDVEFASPAGSEMENVPTAVIAVNLSHGWSEVVTVDYEITAGTATGGGVDYTLLGNGTLTFDAWEVTQYISIEIVDDQLHEGLETVLLTLSNPTNAKLGDIAEHTFTINDNETVIVSEEFVGDQFSSFNHASTIAETHSGVLVVAWYGGSSEGADDVSIWASRNDGNGWSPRMEVCDGGGDATWNPALFQPSSGPLLLFYKYGGSFGGGWEGSLRLSYDDGQTWSARIPLPTCSDPYLSAYNGRFVGPVKNKPLELPDGSLLCGSSTEHDGWQVHMEIARADYTSDYQLIGPLGGSEAIQPTFLVHSDDYMTIQALCRAGGSGNPTRVTWSYDGGQSWTSLSTIGHQTSKGLDATTINNLNSTRNRWHILAYNPSGRYPLRIATSRDGVSWNVAIDNVDDAGDDMDYPAIIQTSDKMLHLTYSWSGKKKIKHVVLNPYILLDEAPDTPIGDLNGDCSVDANDLRILASDWLETGGTGTPPDANNLVLHYSFDGSLGGDVPGSLMDDTGTYTATIIAGSDPDSTITYADPNPIYNTDGTSVQFNNDNWSNNAGDTLLIPNSGGLDFGSFSEFTVELFVYPSSAGSGHDRRIFSEYIYAYMYLDTGNTLHAIRKWGGGAWNENWTHLTKAGMPHDEWSHVAMTWDSDAAGNKFRLYVNGGDPVASAPGTSTPTIDSTAGFVIGGYQREDTSRAQFFHGKIDEFGLYNYALPKGEIAYIAGQGQIPPDSPANLYVDGIINFRDFAIFALQWLDTCE